MAVASPEDRLTAARIYARHLYSRELSFRDFVRRVFPSFAWHRHCQVIGDVLERVERGELRRVMIFAPPRSGKSEQVSRLFSAYYLTKHPDRWVGLASYGSELAYTLSRLARRYYAHDGRDEIDAETTATKHWETGLGGGLWAAGVGAAQTGKGFDLGIIDDPVKDAEEAMSDRLRDRAMGWYRSTFYTRQEKDAAIVLVTTRWHEGDPAGQLLAEDAGRDHPERWHVVNLPAIAEPPIAVPATCTLEPDWRALGEPLCPERASLESLARIREGLGSYYWNALYQQRPHPPEGNLARREWFQIVPEAPSEARRVRRWDKAATEDGDYTCGVLLAHHAGVYYVEDVVRGRWSVGARDAIMRQTADMDHEKRRGSVRQEQPQDPGQAGKGDAAAYMRLMSGRDAHVTPVETGSKLLRALPFFAQAEAGNVKIVAGPWNQDFIGELVAFPTGRNDDQVDAVAGAFESLAANRLTCSIA